MRLQPDINAPNMKKHSRHLLLVLLMSAWPLVVSAGDSISFSSGERQVHLLELYTSQGCSSCPPADRWMNQFKRDDGLWERLVPVAFHVDYWDYLGWRDTLAKRQYSDRQRRYRNNGDIRAVYTPGFVLNGREWKGWFSKDSLPSTTAETGVLSAELNKHRLSVSYSQPEPGMTLNVAILGFDIESDIGDGENAGRRLPYDFVVLAHQSYSSANGQWQIDLPAVDGTPAARHGIALWVTPTGSAQPLQATGSWLTADNLRRL